VAVLNKILADPKKSPRTLRFSRRQLSHVQALIKELDTEFKKLLGRIKGDGDTGSRVTEIQIQG
jgi:hypothetical protein